MPYSVVSRSARQLSRRSVGAENHELLSRPGHRDVAVDDSCNSLPELFRFDEDHEVEFESL